MKKELTDFELSKNEDLLLHNLVTRKYWAEKRAGLEAESMIDTNKPNELKTDNVIPYNWEMVKGIELFAWQRECVDRWKKLENGTIKVVTGAGKTILALAITEALQARNQDLRVAIVVPTIVLQNQWYKEILSNTNLPHEAVGRMGGGYKNKFTDRVRILICVLKSASVYLPSIVKKANVESNLLLIADECHRAGAPDMSKLFKTKRRYNLGLSATPEREDYIDDTQIESPDQYSHSLLGKELGPIIYEMTTKEALEQGILPEFEIHHCGLSLTVDEKRKYDDLTRRLREATTELYDEGHKFGIHDGNIIRRTQSLAVREDQLGFAARLHIKLTNERKRLLYNAKSRHLLVLEILKEEFEKNSETRAILFHESIENVMSIYHMLDLEKFPVTVEHSQLSDEIRDESISLFRQGIAKVIVSARSLIEGFNVPETDIGIIVASNTSVRQRIQTIGRLLRKGKEKNKVATIYVLYIHETVDEIIYGKADWDNLLGMKRNRFFLWDEENGYIEQAGPPRGLLPNEKEIKNLKMADEYPGGYEGIEYSCDSSGNVYTSSRQIVINPQGYPELVKKVKGSYGRFKVTPVKKYVLVIVPQDDEWIVKYAGQLQEPFRTNDDSKSAVNISGFDFSKLKLGDPYPHQFELTTEETVYFKQSRGRYVLARRKGRGEQFARIEGMAEDQKKGADATQPVVLIWS